MPERSRRRSEPKAERRRRPVGEVKKIWRKRDRQWRFALRIWWQGERVWVPLGLETDGWNDYRAKLELEDVVREIEAGVWRPPPSPLDANDRDPTFHEFATLWLDEKEADLERNTYADYLNLLTNHPAAGVPRQAALADRLRGDQVLSDGTVARRRETQAR
jgi:hypothetical protein